MEDWRIAGYEENEGIGLKTSHKSRGKLEEGLKSFYKSYRKLNEGLD